MKFPFVNVNARAGFALQRASQAAMVFVRMGEDDAFDVYGGKSEFAQLIAQGDQRFIGFGAGVY